MLVALPDWKKRKLAFPFPSWLKSLGEWPFLWACWSAGNSHSPVQASLPLTALSAYMSATGFAAGTSNFKFLFRKGKKTPPNPKSCWGTPLDQHTDSPLLFWLFPFCTSFKREMPHRAARCLSLQPPPVSYIVFNSQPGGGKPAWPGFEIPTHRAASRLWQKES